MTLSDYVQRRNGVPLGAGDSLRNMLSRSLGAGTFSEFWQYWNPIWGYYLGMYIFKPLKSFLPASLSLIITFVACGFIHDLAVMLLKWKFSLLLTQWFLFMGLCVIMGEYANINYSKFPWIVRTAINILVISGCFVIANQLNKVVLTIFVVSS
ncbi:MBOAT family O-acyltransferase [uncultured Draconibacterium sp.]|uniref:MBOAT family O-acyltransferase n=1 Tax=uncultured Draconibacterium sp. TaxID=1573823 RepID=UPI0025DB0E28|nr:MBOAT family O-acyltransferase [uncultured Draconibacterium sp.]